MCCWCVVLCVRGVCVCVCVGERAQSTMYANMRVLQCAFERVFLVGAREGARAYGHTHMHHSAARASVSFEEPSTGAGMYARARVRYACARAGMQESLNEFDDFKNFFEFDDIEHTDTHTHTHTQTQTHTHSWVRVHYRMSLTTLNNRPSLK